MVKGSSIHLNVCFIDGTFDDIMFTSYLWLHIGYDFTYATNGKFNYNSHLQLVSNCKLTSQNGVFLVMYNVLIITSYKNSRIMASSLTN